MAGAADEAAWKAAAAYWEQAVVDAGKVLASTAGLLVSVLLLLCIFALRFEPAKAAVARLKGLIDRSLAPLFGTDLSMKPFILLLATAVPKGSHRSAEVANGVLTVACCLSSLAIRYRMPAARCFQNMEY